MGNQLVSIAPSQIISVERYLTDLADMELEFEKSLGSTRFMKVALARIPEGLVVVKVFARHDPSLQLHEYKCTLEQIRKNLSSMVKSIPFQKAVITDRSALIIREYVKYSLYDRISTRPFLTHIEKLWITFQTLHALRQCHSVGVCHGDIKLENIMVTSWNWVLLVDFASFKPTFLPENNPADYSYYFDTSRRRTCYLAPERFTTNDVATMGELTPAMDIFAAGCCLLELWNELHVPFEYSKLLAYRSGKYSPSRHLDRLGDEDLRELIQSMIAIDPNVRLKAEDYLDKYRNGLFPEYFYTYLQWYMLNFSTIPLLSADEKVERLHNDLAYVLDVLRTDDDNHYSGIVIIISLLTSCVRSQFDSSTKFVSMDMLLELAKYSNAETILDRILPYIMHFAKDDDPQLRSAAIYAITECLDMVDVLPRSDSNIFPEYILPGLVALVTDPNTDVRVAYAFNVAQLAQISMRYLDQCQNDYFSQSTENVDGDATTPKDPNNFNYEQELLVLQNMMQQIVSSLLTDPQSIVKQTLIENGLEKLCLFFGKLKANDIILSHMITFLNDKEDTQLRESFFQCIVSVAAYIGHHCSGILKPLLLQGLADASEFVAIKSIDTMTGLVELELLPKSIVYELVRECAVLLVHPNMWIRQAVVGLLIAVASSSLLSPLDVQYKIMPIIRPYLKQYVYQIHKAAIVLDCLVEPIPREIYDDIVNFTHIDELINTFNKRMVTRGAGSQPVERLPATYDTSKSVTQIFLRLFTFGMNDRMEDYLLCMASYLRKIHKQRQRTLLAAQQTTNENPGQIVLTTKGENATKVEHSFFLLSDIDPDTKTNEFLIDGLEATHGRGIFDGTGTVRQMSRSSSPTQSTAANYAADNFTCGDTAANQHQPQERCAVQNRYTKCFMSLARLKAHQRQQYATARIYHLRHLGDWAWQHRRLPPPDWQLRGELVAHLHEHNEPITRVCSWSDSGGGCDVTSSMSHIFATSSTDGIVRVWDANKIEGKNIANRSRAHVRLLSRVYGMAVCEGGDSMAAITKSGDLQIFRLEEASSKLQALHHRSIDTQRLGQPVDLHSLDGHNILVYGTLFGTVEAWDVRMGPDSVAWRLSNTSKRGFLTTFCVDSHRQSWVTLGTSRGAHTVWDLRFLLPINNIDDHSGVRVKKVICHPVEHSWIISSINEIYIWNLETGFREKALWGASTPPLSKPTGNTNSVSAMVAGRIERSAFVISGGSDFRIRFWNLDSPHESFLAVPSATDPPNFKLNYQHRLIDGTHVTYEEPIQSFVPDGRSAGIGGVATSLPENPLVSRPAKLPSGQPADHHLLPPCSGASTSSCCDNEMGSSRGRPELPAPGHRNFISDMAMVKATQCFLVSASQDGIVKVWK